MEISDIAQIMNKDLIIQLQQEELQGLRKMLRKYQENSELKTEMIEELKKLTRLQHEMIAKLEAHVAELETRPAGEQAGQDTP